MPSSLTFAPPDASAHTRSRAGVLVGVGVAMVALCAVAGVVIGRTTAPDSPANPSAGVVQQMPAPVDWSIPTTAPTGLQWQPVDTDRLTTWMPLSTVYGPTASGPGEWGMWSQSPMGAVMAAWTISAYVPDNATLRSYLLGHAITTTEFLDAALARRPADGPTAPHVTRRPTGFRVDSYAPDEAVISLRESVAVAGGQPLSTASTLKVRWQEGDWRVVYLPDDYAATQNPPAGAFVAWGPA